MEEKNSGRLLFLDTALLLAIVVLAFIIYSVTHPIKGKPVPDVLPVKIVEEVASTTPILKTFESGNILAKAAYVYNLSKDEVIFQKNANLKLPLASITKLMTALVATELVPKDLNVTVKEEFLTGEDAEPLEPGETWKLSDLLDFSLVTSSNDGVRSIASVIGSQVAQTTDFDLGEKEFILNMNNRAATLGMTRTKFLNESGLDESTTTAGAYGTASDVAKLLTYIVKNHPDIVEATRHATSSVSSLSRKYIARNTDSVLNKIPNVIASKTGYTYLAGGNLAVVFEPRPMEKIVVVVLGSTQEGRFSDVARLVKSSINYLQGTTTTAVSMQN